MPPPGPFAPSGLIRSFAYRTLWSCASTLHRGATACLCLAAGLLRQQELREASRIHWREYGVALDDIDFGLTPAERQLYGEALRRSDRVLLVGCGTGRDLVALLELGYDVSGLEQSPELVALARGHLARRGRTAPVQAGFIETYSFDTTYDVVVIAGACYSYIQSSAARVATLARIKAHLTDRGRIVLTYLATGRRSAWSSRLTRVAAAVARAGWQPELGDSFSPVPAAPRVLRYEHRFLPGEAAAECAGAGLRVIRDVEMEPPLQCAIAAAYEVEPATLASTASQTAGSSESLRG